VLTVIQTGRGNYWIKLLGEPERSADRITLTLVLERDDGIERVAFRCSIMKNLVPSASAEDPSTLLPGIAQWLTREFEQVREAALKRLRTEHQLLEVSIEPSALGSYRARG